MALLLTRKYSSEELSNLEAWRGVLSLMVFTAHLVQIFIYPIIGIDGVLLHVVGIIANGSVICFFVLSGMLIAYSGINLTKDGKFNWRKFLINRFSRIYPTYLFVLILSFFLIKFFFYLNNNSYSIGHLPTDKYLARDNCFVSGKSFLLSAISMKNFGVSVINGPLWSLFVEWWLYFYGMFLLLAIATPSCFQKTLFLALALCFLKYSSMGDYRMYYYIAIWSLGFVYTLYLHNMPKIVNVLFLVVLLAVLVLIFIFGIKSFDTKNTQFYFYGFFQILVALLFLKSMLKVRLSNYLVKLGEFSYSLYVLHFPLLIISFALIRHYTKDNPIYSSLTSIVLYCIVLYCIILYLSYYMSKFLERSTFIKTVLYNLNDKFENKFIKRK